MIDLGGEKALLKECLRGIIYQEILPTTNGDLGVLMAYRFYQEELRFTWEEGLEKSEERNQAVTQTTD